jgi:hypothetical protein
MLARPSLTKSPRVSGASFALLFGLWEVARHAINHNLTVATTVGIVASAIIGGFGIGLITHYQKMVADNRAQESRAKRGAP